VVLAVVDVACADTGSAFSGDLQHCQSVRLAFTSFLRFFRDAGKGVVHEELEGLELNLCQCPMYQRKGRKRRREGQGEGKEEGVWRKPPLWGLWEDGHVDM
jgi:hypothetical protein